MGHWNKAMIDRYGLSRSAVSRKQSKGCLELFSHLKREWNSLPISNTTEGVAYVLQAVALPTRPASGTIM